MTELVIRVASDQIDSFILLVAQIAIVLSTVSIGISTVFLIDYFKRHGWMYKHKPKKKDVVEYHDIDPGFSADREQKEVDKLKSLKGSVSVDTGFSAEKKTHHHHHS